MDVNTIDTQPVDIMNVQFPLMLPTAGSFAPNETVIIDDGDGDAGETAEADAGLEEAGPKEAGPEEAGPEEAGPEEACREEASLAGPEEACREEASLAGPEEAWSEEAQPEEACPCREEASCEQAGLQEACPAQLPSPHECKPAAPAVETSTGTTVAAPESTPDKAQKFDVMNFQAGMLHVRHTYVDLGSC